MMIKYERLYDQLNVIDRPDENLKSFMKKLNFHEENTEIEFTDICKKNMSDI